MPRLFELQQTLKSQNRVMETRFDNNSGEESLVVDERSQRSNARVVEEKLYRLTGPRFGSFTPDDYPQ